MSTELRWAHDGRPTTYVENGNKQFIITIPAPPIAQYRLIGAAARAVDDWQMGQRGDALKFPKAVVSTDVESDQQVVRLTGTITEEMPAFFAQQHFTLETLCLFAEYVCRKSHTDLWGRANERRQVRVQYNGVDEHLVAHDFSVGYA